MADFQLNVDPQVYQAKIDEVKTEVSKYQSLIDQYETKKNQVDSIWGDEDENKEKAKALCESAIKVVNQKLQEAQTSAQNLQKVLEAATSAGNEVSSALDDAKSAVDALLR